MLLETALDYLVSISIFKLSIEQYKIVFLDKLGID
jgi:hypothetical protein